MPQAENPFAQLLAVAREVSFVKGAELVRQGEASRAAFLDIYNGNSGTTVRLHHAIHRSLMRSIH